jgi:hypothetical protein
MQRLKLLVYIDKIIFNFLLTILNIAVILDILKQTEHTKMTTDLVIEAYLNDDTKALQEIQENLSDDTVFFWTLGFMANSSISECKSAGLWATNVLFKIPDHIKML